MIYGAITTDVLAFILLGNGLAGIAFGRLYWRHGLEAAMMAHVVAFPGASPFSQNRYERVFETGGISGGDAVVFQ